MTPGHTPGSLSVRISSRGETAWLVGDAITCPVQLVEPTWHSFGDVAPQAAHRSRQYLWRELARPATWGTGAHFPRLAAGRVGSGSAREWLPR